jgi:protein dithiol:quinone oxidoreductase
MQVFEMFAFLQMLLDGFPTGQWNHLRHFAPNQAPFDPPTYPKGTVLEFLVDLFDRQPRRVFDLIVATCVALLGYGMYLQHVVGLEPCPMCVVQRYAFVLIAVCALLARLSGKKTVHYGGAGLLVLLAGFGAFVAARQSWLQWYPPEIASCGRDIYGMIENFPLQRAIPMIFKGSGDCTKVDWIFLGGSIANWSFLCFVGLAVVALALIWRQSRVLR